MRHLGRVLMNRGWSATTSQCPVGSALWNQVGRHAKSEKCSQPTARPLLKHAANFPVLFQTTVDRPACISLWHCHRVAQRGQHELLCSRRLRKQKALHQIKIHLTHGEKSDRVATPWATVRAPKLLARSRIWRHTVCLNRSSAQPVMNCRSILISTKGSREVQPATAIPIQDYQSKWRCC